MATSLIHNRADQEAHLLLLLGQAKVQAPPPGLVQEWVADIATVYLRIPEITGRIPEDIARLYIDLQPRRDILEIAQAALERPLDERAALLEKCFSCSLQDEEWVEFQEKVIQLLLEKPEPPPSWDDGLETVDWDLVSEALTKEDEPAPLPQQNSCSIPSPPEPIPKQQGGVSEESLFKIADRLYCVDKRYADVIAMLQGAKTFNGLCLLGRACVKLKQYKNAAASFEGALKVASTGLDRHFVLHRRAQMYLEQGEREKVFHDLVAAFKCGCSSYALGIAADLLREPLLFKLDLEEFKQMNWVVGSLYFNRGNVGQAFEFFSAVPDKGHPLCKAVEEIKEDLRKERLSPQERNLEETQEREQWVVVGPETSLFMPNRDLLRSAVTYLTSFKPTSELEEFCRGSILAYALETHTSRFREEGFYLPISCDKTIGRASWSGGQVLYKAQFFKAARICVEAACRAHFRERGLFEGSEPSKITILYAGARVQVAQQLAWVGKKEEAAKEFWQLYAWAGSYAVRATDPDLGYLLKGFAAHFRIGSVEIMKCYTKSPQVTDQLLKEARGDTAHALNLAFQKADKEKWPTSRREFQIMPAGVKADLKRGEKYFGLAGSLCPLWIEVINTYFPPKAEKS